MDILQIIAEQVKIDTAIGARNGETKSESIRNAALQIHEDHPGVTARQFGQGAALSGLTKENSAINRWNEARANWGDDW